MDTSPQNPYRATGEQRPADSLETTILRLAVPIFALIAVISAIEILAIIHLAARVGLHYESCREFFRTLNQLGCAQLFGCVVVVLALRHWLVRHLRKRDTRAPR